MSHFVVLSSHREGRLVGKVDAFAVEGLELWFWFDDHIPPHFHVKKAGDWEIKVHVLETTAHDLSFEVKWGKGPSGKLQSGLAKEVAKHRDALYTEWLQKTRSGAE